MSASHCPRAPRHSSHGFCFTAWYFALAEGAEKALVADLTPAGHRGAAFGLYNAVTGIGRSIASVLFGELY